MRNDKPVGPALAVDLEPTLGRPARTLLRYLREHDEPRTVADLADALDRHTNSVRAHLDELVDAGLVITQSAPAVGRGRPATLYSAAPRPVPAISLVKPLAATVAAMDDSAERSRDAGVSWATQMNVQDQPERLEETLNRLGFEPELDSGTYKLHACPWLEAAVAYPGVVCTLHHGLTQAIVGDGTVVELVPFTDHRTCDLRVRPRNERA